MNFELNQNCANIHKGLKHFFILYKIDHKAAYLYQQLRWWSKNGFLAFSKYYNQAVQEGKHYQQLQNLTKSLKLFS